MGIITHLANFVKFYDRFLRIHANIILKMCFYTFNVLRFVKYLSWPKFNFWLAVIYEMAFLRPIALKIVHLGFF